jgi:N-acetylneuraminate lyase
MNLRFTRLIAAPFTPFHADGSLHLERIPDLAAALRESRVAGAFVCGTTGECSSLTTAERKAVAERWKSVSGTLRIIVHAGHTSAAEARDLIAHAASIGADAVAVTAPYYFRPVGPAELVDFLAEVASAAPNLPFHYYDIPSTTGVLMHTTEVLRRAAMRIPNFAGVKFSNPDLLTFQECVQLDGGKHEAMFGVDEYLLAAAALGATGAVGSTYNYAAPIYHRMLDSLRAGDLEAARNRQFGSVELVRALIDFGGLRAGKAIMNLIGLDCGPVRTPLRKFLADDECKLFDRLKGLDIFSHPLRRPES